MKVFSVYDAKAKAFASPFFMQHSGMAIRAFGDACGDPQSMLSKHAGDYQLFEIGSWDEGTGVFTNTVPALLLSSGIEWKSVDKEPVAPVLKAVN